MLSLTTESTRLFFGPEGQGIAQYDSPRYPIFHKWNKHMRSFFWEPETVTMAGERRSFNSMIDAEQFGFTSTLQRLIMLDTIQGRAPVQVFGPHVTDPSLENCITTWQFFESIHSESYTHILRAIYPDPAAIRAQIPHIKEIADCSMVIDSAYERLRTNPNKENLYLALIEANALEALRFHLGFSYIFNLKKRKFVQGSGDIAKLIARDENVHLGLVAHIIKALPKDDPEFETIMADNRERALKVYDDAVEQEKTWAQYIFSHGPVLGQNEEMVCEYLDRQKLKATNQLGLTNKKLPPLNFTYMDEYIENADKIQAAPQEDGAVEYVSASSLHNDLAEYKLSLALPSMFQPNPKFEVPA